MAKNGWFYVTSEKNPKKRKLGGQNMNKTMNICSIVIILLHYLDNIIRFIFQKFQIILTSITVKLRSLEIFYIKLTTNFQLIAIFISLSLARWVDGAN